MKRRDKVKRYALVLLEYKANVNAKNIFDNTPPRGAIEKGFKNIIPILLKNGASIKIENSHGFSPLEFAFKRQTKFKGHIDEIDSII
ncbi:hypothetical protein WA026_011672 [Henosepilachna vigintioctopunctata]|uniref:Ankyrin repeat protein n=1 Tax=Henosepilachna vigintioctopunctata TaxID=420089 RepID=A0AAW1UH54_9CUCU